MELVFVDTSAFYALASRGDRHHRQAVAIARQLDARGAIPFTSNYIVAESHALLLKRSGHRIARGWLGDLSARVEQAKVIDQVRALSIVLSHDDKTYSLTDATSFAVMERLAVGRAFAFDNHFTQYGFELEVAGH
jgi:predicted nucleic acid-binding protein